MISVTKGLLGQHYAQIQPHQVQNDVSWFVDYDFPSVTLVYVQHGRPNQDEADQGMKAAVCWRLTSRI